MWGEWESGEEEGLGQGRQEHSHVLPFRQEPGHPILPGPSAPPQWGASPALRVRPKDGHSGLPAASSRTNWLELALGSNLPGNPVARDGKVKGRAWHAHTPPSPGKVWSCTNCSRGTLASGREQGRQQGQQTGSHCQEPKGDVGVRKQRRGGGQRKAQDLRGCEEQGGKAEDEPSSHLEPGGRLGLGS